MSTCGCKNQPIPKSWRFTVPSFGNGTLTLTLPNGDSAKYASTGEASAYPNPGGGRWTMAYDLARKVESILNPYAQRTTFAYDGSGNIQQIQDAAGRVVAARDALGKSHVLFIRCSRKRSRRDQRAGKHRHDGF